MELPLEEVVRELALLGEASRIPEGHGSETSHKELASRLHDRIVRLLSKGGDRGQLVLVEDMKTEMPMDGGGGGTVTAGDCLVAQEEMSVKRAVPAVVDDSGLVSLKVCEEVLRCKEEEECEDDSSSDPPPIFITALLS